MQADEVSCFISNLAFLHEGGEAQAGKESSVRVGVGRKDIMLMASLVKKPKAWSDTVNIISYRDLQDIPASDVGRIRKVQAKRGAVDLVVDQLDGASDTDAVADWEQLDPGKQETFDFISQVDGADDTLANKICSSMACQPRKQCWQ